MRNRGTVYWDWADPAIHCRSVSERMTDGTLFDVQVRTSAQWEIQLFIGVYGEKGMMIFEEAFDSRPGESMTKALEWGVKRAKEMSPEGSKKVNLLKTEPLPRSGSRQKK